MKLCLFAALAAIVLSVGCGKEERREAAALNKVLTEQHSGFTSSIANEKDFVSSVRGWCAGITTAGGGRGATLDQNLTVAQDLAKSAAAISAQVGQVRQAVYDLPLQKEFTQGVRSTLIGELTRRQRELQEFRSALQDTATAFDGFRQSRDYKGETYPAGIDKLSQALQRYKEPGDALADALNTLSAKYGAALAGS